MIKQCKQNYRSLLCIQETGQTSLLCYRELIIPGYMSGHFCVLFIYMLQGHSLICDYLYYIT